MNIMHLIENMSEDMYLRLKYAAETGKWPEGTVVDDKQRESALQLSMAYQAKYLDSKEMLSVGADGKIVNKTKRELKAEFTGEAPEDKIAACPKTNQDQDIARFKNL